MQAKQVNHLQLSQTYPSAPRTKRGDFSSLEIASDHLLYFNGPTLIVKPLTPSKQMKHFVHKSDVLAAKFSNDGKLIASIDQKGTLMIHELGEVQLFQSKKYENFYPNAKAIDWSADRKRICVVGSGKNCFGRVALIDSGTNAGEITGVSANLTCCSFRPERPYNLVVGGDQYILKFYQGPPYKFTKSSAKNHSNFINGIKYSPLGTYFVTVSSDKKIILYDGQSFDQLKEKSNCHERSILGVDWIDEKRFVTVSADKTIKIWSSDLEELNVIHTCDQTYFKDGKSFEHFQVAVKVYNGKIYSLSLNGEISEYLIPSQQDKIIFFNSEKINRHAGWLEKPVYVSNVSAGSDQKVITVDSAGRLLEIDRKSNSINLLRLKNVLSSSIISSVYCKKNNSINIVSADGSLTQFRVQNDNSLVQRQVFPQDRIKIGQKKLKFITNSTIPQYNVVGLGSRIVAFSDKDIKQSPQLEEDGTFLRTFENLIVIGTIKGNIYVFNGQTLQFLTKTNVSSTKISCIYIQKGHDEASYTVITGDALGKFTTLQFDITNSQLTQQTNTLGNHQSLITSIISYRQNWLLTCGMDNKINLWLRTSPGKYSRLDDWRNVHHYGILSAQIIGDNLFTLGGDYLIKEWKLQV